uniref:Craniofacial development protein 2-like n=1 Tax=Nicotiana tabacum TaxID=4097 RepID=A0A1S3Z4M1_TOBAC|nr:PREDICTED: uncharacterized protein LOC107782915 [Nicotiana tabacum]
MGGLGRGNQKAFWENLDEVVLGVPHTEKLFIGGDFNGHIGAILGLSSGGALTKDEPQELGDKSLAIGHGGVVGTREVCEPRKRIALEVAREVLAVLKGYSIGHKGDWWWNGEVEGKEEAEKAMYLKLLESVDEEEKRMNMERYKMAKKEAKLAVTTTTKTVAFELYEEL